MLVVGLGPRPPLDEGYRDFLVRELVELHGGSVRLDSAPGQGSTFTLSLPRQRP